MRVTCTWIHQSAASSPCGGLTITAAVGDVFTVAFIWGRHRRSGAVWPLGAGACGWLGGRAHRYQHAGGLGTTNDTHDKQDTDSPNSHKKAEAPYAVHSLHDGGWIYRAWLATPFVMNITMIQNQHVHQICQPRSQETRLRIYMSVK